MSSLRCVGAQNSLPEFEWPWKAGCSVLDLSQTDATLFENAKFQGDWKFPVPGRAVQARERRTRGGDPLAYQVSWRGSNPTSVITVFSKPNP